MGLKERFKTSSCEGMKQPFHLHFEMPIGQYQMKSPKTKGMEESRSGTQNYIDTYRFKPEVLVDNIAYLQQKLSKETEAQGNPFNGQPLSGYQ